MKIEFEIIHPDEGSSFRILHNKTNAEEYPWLYHYHPEYELVCVLYGSGTRHVGNHFSNYENGDLVFMGPNLPHAGFGLDAHGPHEEIVIQIRETVFKQSVLTRPEMAAITELLEKVKFGVSFTGATKAKITERLTHLTKLAPFEKFMELISILQMMATTTEYEVLNPQTIFSSALIKNNIRLQNIFNYVEQHFQEEIDIRKVATIANLSVSSFCTYFKKIMNTTFTDFLNKYRIQKACMMLQQEKTISETCFECGFNNVPYFNKVFKTVTGKTPSAFKKEKLKIHFFPAKTVRALVGS
jgi:AraC-like DNA-binding protein/quercetin dioxygenase-like cupin family protein